MRIWFVVIGVVVALVGATLLYVPVYPQPTQTVPALPGPPTYYIGNVTGAPITGKIPVSISWTANVTVTVIGGACTNHCVNFTDLSSVTLQAGTSGSFTVDQPIGGSIFFGANASGSTSGLVTFKVTSALSTLASALVIVGVVLALIGVFLRTQKPSPAIATVPAPGAPSPSPTPAPAAPSD